MRIKAWLWETTAWWRGLWMKRGWHHLHCTGGGQVVPDRRGTYVRSADELAVKARRRLMGLKAALPAGMDWSVWMVDVHDARGRHVVYVDFDPEAEWDHDVDDPTARD